MNFFGKCFRVEIFGESHGPAIGVVIDGVKAGMPLSAEDFKEDIGRRKSGAKGTTQRIEADEPEILSGVFEGHTTGAPIAIIFRNTNTRSADYEQLRDVPRPGHSDWTASVKYGGFQDYAGGGHFSGRLTAPLCIAGGICRQLLEREGITLISRIAQIGPVCDEGALIASTAEKDFPVVDDAKGAQMRESIAAARAEGDSLGGVVECAVLGLPAGLGDPMFDGMENRIARIVFGIPAVKGLEFGDGFRLAALRGSEANDSYAVENGRLVTVTNHCGAPPFPGGHQAHALHCRRAAERGSGQYGGDNPEDRRAARPLHRPPGGAGGGGRGGGRGL